MKITLVPAILAAAMLGAIASPALAHTSVMSTTPVSGAVLPTSPPEVEITFHDEARLTSMVVAGPDGAERKLDFMPSGAAKTFMAHDPKLAMGRNEVKWKALSKDGHPVEGSIIIVIKPGATPAKPAMPMPMPEHKDH